MHIQQYQYQECIKKAIIANWDINISQAHIKTQDIKSVTKAYIYNQKTQNICKLIQNLKPILEFCQQ